jgi:uncharacterized protein (DUF2267 family)
MVQQSRDDDICGAVRQRVSLPSAAEAEQLVQGVLQALAYVLPPQQIEALCACVPDDLSWCLRCGPATPDPLIDSELFLGWVMSSLETTGGSDRTLGGEDPLASLAADEARYRVQVVLAELWRRLDGEQARACAACVPVGLADGVEPRRRK